MNTVVIRKSRSIASPFERVKKMDITGSTRLSIDLQDRGNVALTNGALFDYNQVSGSVDGGTTFHFNDGSVLDLRVGTSGIGADTQSVYGSFA